MPPVSCQRGSNLLGLLTLPSVCLLGRPLYERTAEQVRTHPTYQRAVSLGSVFVRSTYLHVTPDLLPRLNFNVSHEPIRRFLVTGEESIA